MNLVALLIAPAVIKFSYGDHSSMLVRVLIAVFALLVIVVAVYVSKRRGIAVGDEDSGEVSNSTPPAVVP